MAEKAEQGGINLVGVGAGDGMRAALYDDEVHVRDEAGQSLAGLVERQNPVGVTLDDQYRDVDLRQVGTEVGLPGRHAGDRRDGGHRDGHVKAGAVGLVADAVAAELVDVVEEVEESFQPGGSVSCGRLAEPVEQIGWYPVGVVRGLGQVRGIGPMSTARSIFSDP